MHLVRRSRLLLLPLAIGCSSAASLDGARALADAYVRRQLREAPECEWRTLEDFSVRETSSASDGTHRIAYDERDRCGGLPQERAGVPAWIACERARAEAQARCGRREQPRAKPAEGFDIVVDETRRVFEAPSGRR